MLAHKNGLLSKHRQAVLLAVLVTVLWSSSWLLIKIGLQDIPALTFAGLRYSLAFLILLPFNFTPEMQKAYRRLTRKDVLFLVALGVLQYSLTQGAQFIGLSYLPMTTTSLLLNLTSLVVAVAGIFVLSERLSVLQWGGVLLNLLGVIIFFYPPVLPGQEWIGILVVLIGMLANAASALLGRKINRQGHLPAMLVTTVSMGIGGPLLLIGGWLTQPAPQLNLNSWLIIFWLALVNTALAFSIWNYTLRVLRAMESTLINSTMMIQIALLGWVVFHEDLSGLKIVGMILALAGLILTQLRKQPNPANQQSDI
jgi:drug/metabolite transporter (DMT)-like permease